MPASATRLAPAGLAATLLPIKKNVDLASLSLSICSSRSVYGLGPSSNVRATHLTCEQSMLSAPALRTWPVRPPTTSTAAATSTPNTVRQYRQTWLSCRFGTQAAYRGKLLTPFKRSLCAYGEEVRVDLALCAESTQRRDAAQTSSLLGDREMTKIAICQQSRRRGSGKGPRADLLEHLSDQRRDRRALTAQQRDVREERVALELLDH